MLEIILTRLSPFPVALLLLLVSIKLAECSGGSEKITGQVGTKGKRSEVDHSSPTFWKPAFYPEIVAKLNALHSVSYNATTFYCNSSATNNLYKGAQGRGNVDGVVSGLQWTNFKVYVDPLFNLDQYKLVSDSVAQIEKILENCKITFNLYEPGATHPSPLDDHVHIVSGNKCESNVGMQGGRQNLVLNQKTCFHSHIVLHNLLHALGLLHEHNRPDRDDFVHVLWENVRPDSTLQFYKSDPSFYNTYGIPYDIHSIMHFSSFAASKNGLPTIVAKDGSQTGTWSGKMRHGDMDRLRKIYCS